MFKKVRHNIERRGDTITITGHWKDEMKRPAAVRLNFERGEMLDENNETIMKGDVSEIVGALNGMADMAWEMGWRPRAMTGMIAALVANYKIPPASK